MKIFKDILRRGRKSLTLMGLVAGLAMGSAATASASSWDFSYSGAGVNATGTFTAVLNAQGIWDITSVSGTRNGQGITGLWCGLCQTLQPGFGSSDNYIVNAGAGAPGSPNWVDPQLDLHYLVGGTDAYIFAFILNYNAPTMTETHVGIPPGSPTLIDYPGTGRCVVGSPGCTELTSAAISAVPEINASSGVAALGVLLGFALVFRELFMRRRDLALLGVR